MIRPLLFLASYFAILSVNAQDLGPDAYLNEKAAYMCDRIAESEIPVETMHYRQAYGLANKRGPEESNKMLKHQSDLKAKGIEDGELEVYGGYMRMYMLQACEGYVRYWMAMNNEHKGNDQKRRRFVEIHKFIRDLMQAEELSEIHTYAASTDSSTIAQNLLPYLEGMQNIRWQSSLVVISADWMTNEFIVQIIDINDTEHMFEIEIKYRSIAEERFNSLTIAEYTLENPKPNEYIEEETEMPIGY